MPEDLLKEKEIQRNRVKSLVKRKRLFEAARLVTDEDMKAWSQDTQAKVMSISSCNGYIVNTFVIF